jgi:hypothetical protein
MRSIWTPASWWLRRSTQRTRATRRRSAHAGRGQKNLAAAGLALTSEYPSDLVADKGYHSPDGLKDLDGGPWKMRIAEPKPANG